MATDYISREAAIAEIEGESGCDFCWARAKDMCKTMCHTRKKIDRIVSIPAADVQPVVSAEWERPKGSTPRSWIFVCSKCGDRAYFPVPKYFPKGCGYKFCPNCGADMREEVGHER